VLQLYVASKLAQWKKLPGLDEKYQGIGEKTCPCSWNPFRMIYRAFCKPPELGLAPSRYLFGCISRPAVAVYEVTVSFRKAIMVLLPGMKFKSEFTSAQLLLYDKVTSEASENETLADWSIMVLVFFGALHLLLMPYNSKDANYLEVQTLLFSLPVQTAVAQLQFEGRSDTLHPNVRDWYATKNIEAGPFKQSGPTTAEDKKMPDSYMSPNCFGRQCVPSLFQKPECMVGDESGSQCTDTDKMEPYQFDRWMRFKNNHGHLFNLAGELRFGSSPVQQGGCAEMFQWFADILKYDNIYVDKPKAERGTYAKNEFCQSMPTYEKAAGMGPHYPYYGGVGNAVVGLEPQTRS
jgi:hypothetical protein